MLDLLSFDLFLIFRKIDLMLAKFLCLFTKGEGNILFLLQIALVSVLVSVSCFPVCKISNELICCLHQKDNILKFIFVYVLLTLT